MKTTQIQLRFDAAKLKALEFYLPQNGTSVEEELQKRFEELYKNEVPNSVKDFLKFQTGDTSLDKEQANQSEHVEDFADSKPSKKQKNISPKAVATTAEEAPAIIQTM